MPSSFLSYIVDQHRLTFEDVATDALAHVLQNSSAARDALRKCLNNIIADVVPEHFTVEIRLDTQIYGLPDLVLKDKAAMHNH